MDLKEARWHILDASKQKMNTPHTIRENVMRTENNIFVI